MTELVSVIIPAYNGAETIEETLLSVRHQTHRALDIIVVDDGSTDGTLDIVRRQAREDSRIRLIRKANGGVATARNHGIERAAAELIAPVDADDLWHPTKIEKQLAALRRGGERVALVYTWFAVIDEHSRVIDATNNSLDEGNVLRRMCMGNLVGNGSSPLMRRQAVIDAGGYDPGLRAQNAQGCEDLKLYFAISRNHHFAVVKEHLTGYRWTPRNMSSDGMRMLRSYDLVMEPFGALHPEFGWEFHYGRGFFIEWLFQRALRYDAFASAAGLAGALYRHDRPWALRALARGCFAVGRKKLPRKRGLELTPAGTAIFGPTFLESADSAALTGFMPSSARDRTAMYQIEPKRMS